MLLSSKSAYIYCVDNFFTHGFQKATTYTNEYDV